jgi:hypothetical protein
LCLLLTRERLGDWLTRAGLSWEYRAGNRLARHRLARNGLKPGDRLTGQRLAGRDRLAVRSDCGHSAAFTHAAAGQPGVEILLRGRQCRSYGRLFADILPGRRRGLLAGISGLLLVEH